MLPNSLFVAGSHTDAGKTCVSAALCAAFGFSYFKLVQAGLPTDCERVRTLAPDVRILGHGVQLQTPASPHIAMQREGLKYDGLKLTPPRDDRTLIESAGGLFTPLDARCCMIDYAQQHSLPCVLVARYYLGAINHILLSLNALKQREISTLCIIISGEQDSSFDSFIASYSGVKIAHFKAFTDAASFSQNAIDLRRELVELGVFSQN